MEVIRLQNNTPEVYTAYSRDFQLLCRLYDCVINSVKFDVDSIKKISSTHDIQTNLLPLLQTKLGFFSNAKATDEELRLILEAFPILVKSKGSLKSINQALNIFLKTLNLRIPIIVTKTTDETQLYNITLPEHTIVIGLNTMFRTFSQIFKDLLRYILPAGFGFYIYFYSTDKEITRFATSNKVAIIFISDALNSLLRNNAEEEAMDETKTDVEKRLVHSVSLMGVKQIKYPEGITPQDEVLEVHMMDDNGELK